MLVGFYAVCSFFSTAERYGVCAEICFGVVWSSFQLGIRRLWSPSIRHKPSLSPQRGPKRMKGDSPFLPFHERRNATCLMEWVYDAGSGMPPPLNKQNNRSQAWRIPLTQIHHSYCPSHTHPVLVTQNMGPVFGPKQRSCFCKFWALQKIHFLAADSTHLSFQKPAVCQGFWMVS